MVQTIEAVFDGTVLRPQSPLTFAINARVLVTVESLPTPAPAASFLQTARQLELDGPTAGRPRLAALRLPGWQAQKR